MRFRDLFPTLFRPDPAPHLIPGALSGVLRSEDQVEDALRRIRALGLGPHQDRPKNWDAFLAFSAIRRDPRRDVAVVDLGAAVYGRVLRWLRAYGVGDLHGCDRTFTHAFRKHGISFTPQDIQGTDYPSGLFDYATCLSVVEHGVDPVRFFTEAARILKPGGTLLLSTDYWCTAVASPGLYDDLYNCPVTIFTEESFRPFMVAAQTAGFVLPEAIDLRCGEPLVHWRRLDLRFTFLFLELRLRGRTMA